MAEEKFFPEESLRLIEDMINTAKNRFSEDGQLYLVWGWTVFVCSLVQFVLIHFYQSPYHYMVWVLSIGVWIYMFFYLRRKQKREKVRTYADTLLAYVWLTFVILIFFLAFLIGRVTGGEYFLHITPILLAVYGMPVFLSGIILRFRPLVLGGIGCWVLCVVALFIPGFDYQFLMVPVCMLVAWIIPGYLLRSKYRSALK